MNSALDDQFERQFFTYVLDRAVPANAVQDPNALQILSDADFEWWWLFGSRTAAGAAPFVKVLMKEQATGRDFIGTSPQAQAGGAVFNGINIDNWFGTAAANAGMPLAVPYIMPATRVYSLFFTDSSGGNINTVQVCFSGFKLWPRPSLH
jgi:hypothetical protein